MLIYVREDNETTERKQVLVANIETVTELRLGATADKLTGSVDFTKLTARVHRSTLKSLNPKNVEELAPLVKTLVTPELNKALGEGFAIPFSEMFDLVEPSITLDDNRIL